MNEVIWKFEIPVQTNCQVQLPHGCEILSVGCQEDSVFMWGKFTEEYKDRLDTREFEVHGTGHPIPVGVDRKFIGTVHMWAGSLVFHIFEKLS
jgi:uracil DNA glycosylase